MLRSNILLTFLCSNLFLKYTPLPIGQWLLSIEDTHHPGCMPLRFMFFTAFTVFDFLFVLRLPGAQSALCWCRGTRVCFVSPFTDHKTKKMKKIIIFLIFTGSTFATVAQQKAGKNDSTKHVTLYTCSMHPGVSTDKPGKCSVCGMALNRSPKELLKTDVSRVYSCPIHAEVLAKKPGHCSKCGATLNLSVKEKMKADVVKLYTCAMYPDIVSDKPGKCSKCGMELTASNEEHKH